MQQNHPEKQAWEWPEAKEYVLETGGNPPSPFSRHLAESIQITPGVTRLLDLGCGSGIIGIHCLMNKGAASVTFTDIKAEQVSIARTNVNMHIDRGEIAAHQVSYLTASFAEISAAHLSRHDLIAFNPPQLPMAIADKDYLEPLKTDPVGAAFRLGGPDGLNIARHFFQWYAGLTKPRPEAAICISSFLGRSRIEDALNANRFQWRVESRSRVPLRRAFFEAAAEFSKDDQQRLDRSLERTAEGNWTKEIRTILLR